MSVLITGGAGYIGSHMTHALADRGEDVVVLDNLSTGIRSLVAHAAHMVEGDIEDRALVKKLVAERGIDAVIHFAGSIVVSDSVADPLAYYANNTAASRVLIEICVESGIRHFVFSSSAAVYGNGGDAPLVEEVPKDPINPYGRSKLVTEWMLEDVARVQDFRYVTLRYFNVAGADPKGRAGQSAARATHLIKLACQAALGRQRELEIYGTDYPTPDGTCIRDYIHVSDLVAAHVLALDALRAGGPCAVYNAGYGYGFSVREVIAAVERAAGVRVPVRDAVRRPGDPARLVADPTKLKSVLKWAPQFEGLDLIAKHAFEWERRLNW